jgi:predicted CoA-substrate-specific enzyme activase
MLTMGIDIGSRSTKCVILDDGQMLTYGVIETGSDSEKTTYAAVDAAVHRRIELWGEYRIKLPEAKTDHLKIEDMAHIIATGYGRAVVPFAHGTITEINCHARGAAWMVPGVASILDMGGQDCKAMRLGDKGEVTNFILNDKCAGGTGRFLEIVADGLKVPLFEIGPLSLKSTKELPLNASCAVHAKREALTMMKHGESKADILAGLHKSISGRIAGMVKRAGLADKFVITGGISKNTGMVAEIEEQLGGMKAHVPPEPQIAGAVGAALFALDRAKKKEVDAPSPRAAG